jgi:hypothetical protein
MRILKVLRYTTTLLLAATVALALAGSLPTVAEASTNPVDLEFGGEGAMPWAIGNIKPSDSGTKTISLRNIGDKDGFVAVWVSDIISSEGINPESETGDTAEPGELDKYLLFNLNAAGLSTDLTLPVKINDLPHSATEAHYLEIIPIKTGATVNLEWQWQLPAQTGNDIQGDGLSFTINYLLRDFEVTNLSSIVSAGGVFTEEVTIKPEASSCVLNIKKDTIGLAADAGPITELWFIEIEKEPAALSETTVTVGLQYELGPEGITFNQPVILTLAYDPGDIPPIARGGRLAIAAWNSSTGWTELSGCTFDLVNHTVSAPTAHFSRYTIIVQVPSPTPYYPEDTPPVEEKPPQTISAKLDVDMLGQKQTVEIGTDGTLSQPLTLTDHSGNFTVEIGKGTIITGPENTELGRIDLKITDRPIVVPDNMVILSPTYDFTGYTRSMQATSINFNPHATLTIRYDQQNLPENILLPFIANYTDEHGLVPLTTPPDSTVEIGKATALITHASLFVVVAEKLPPAPPLPAKFKVLDLIINPEVANLGEPVTITITITNEGASTGSFELHLTIDGIVRVVREITLPGNSSDTLTFNVSNLAAGKHQVKIAGLTEQFRVVVTTNPPGESDVNWLAIDAGVGSALVIGALGLYFLVRRARRQR